MRSFVISDTHFFHRRILELCPSRAVLGKTVDQMNESLVERWNDTVWPCDTVYHLGDVMFGRPAQAALLSRLNGRKLLLLGNHDNMNLSVYQKYFDVILPSPTQMWNSRTKSPMFFSHAPIHPSCLGGRGGDTTILNVHGHIHERIIKSLNGNPDGRYFNASVEQIDFRPFPMGDLPSAADTLKVLDVEEPWPSPESRPSNHPKSPAPSRSSAKPRRTKS